MKIQPNSRLDREVRDESSVVHPVPADPIRAAVGFLKGRGSATEDLLAERRRERDLEEAGERRLGIPPARQD